MARPKSAKVAFKLTMKNVLTACAVIRANPGKYAEADRLKAEANPRHLQAAGKQAIIEAIFTLYPEQSQRNHHRVTAAFNTGAFPARVNWDIINALGAAALFHKD